MVENIKTNIKLTRHYKNFDILDCYITNTLSTSFFYNTRTNDYPDGMKPIELEQSIVKSGRETYSYVCGKPSSSLY